MASDSLNTQAWLDICRHCAAACENAAQFCMDSGHVENMQDYIQVCWQCADACTMATRFIANNSPLATEVWVACAQACEVCLEASLQYDHPICQRVAAACRECLDLSTSIVG